MEKYIIFIDDEKDSNAALMRTYGEWVAKLTNHDYTAKYILGHPIVQAISPLLELVADIHRRGDVVAGIVIDVVDLSQTPKETYAGLELLDYCVNHPDLQGVPAALFTTTQVPITEEEAKRRGAKGLVKRSLIGGHSATVETREILHVLELI